MTADKVALGARLYFDKRLSSDGTLSCAVCHDPATAFADHHSLAVGVKAQNGTRNVPTILNAMFNEKLFWDGRASSLEEQAKQPLINPVEMGMNTYEAVVARVATIPEYRQRFRRVFGREGITIDTIAKAIAAFERTQLSGNSPFDRYTAGDANAMTEAQQRGWKLFQGKAKCITCHEFKPASPFFTDSKFHNTGIAAKGQSFDDLTQRAQHLNHITASPDADASLLAHRAGASEFGRYIVTRQAQDIGAFKTPTLRDVELTAPYMHNGAEKALLDVVRFYNHGGNPNPSLDQEMHPLNLSDEEMNDLVEFMRALTSDEVLRKAQTSKPQTRAPILFPQPRLDHNHQGSH